VFGIRTSCFAGVAFAVVSAFQAQAAPPRIFYSDLESGPNVGGENGAGVFVTIYGARFGASAGTSFVSLGGEAPVAYRAWSDTRITFQIGPGTPTGNITVTTATGESNGVPFRVRDGRIYFVSPSGRDSNDGSFTSPWRTVLKARDAIGAGDTVYLMNNISQAADDGQGWSTSMLLRRGGAAGAPMAFVAYPGATATIGSATGPSYGIRGVDTGALSGYWVFAGLVLRGASAAMVLAGPSQSWRIVGNDMSCPNGNGEVGCFASSKSSYVSFYGNTVHDAGTANASAHYHGIYWSTDSNHIDMGWNTVYNIRGCRGVQTYSTPLGSGGASDPTGHNLHNISIHDNVIHDTQCDGILLATIDPSQGKVEVYNNVIYSAGRGPANPENTGAWTCVNVPGTTANGSPGGGVVDVFQNTLYDCGSFANPPYANANGAIENGGNNTNLKILLRNNIVYQPATAPYLVTFGPCDGIQGTNNLFFGGGAPPATARLTRSIVADPQFANLTNRDFRLTAASPARGAGVETSTATDRNGILRCGSTPDVGAYQYEAESSNTASVGALRRRSFPNPCRTESPIRVR